MQVITTGLSKDNETRAVSFVMRLAREYAQKPLEKAELEKRKKTFMEDLQKEDLVTPKKRARCKTTVEGGMQKKRPAAISVDDDIPSSPVAKDADEAEGDDGENHGSGKVDSCDGEKLSSGEEEE